MATLVVIGRVVLGKGMLPGLTDLQLGPTRSASAPSLERARSCVCTDVRTFLVDVPHAVLLNVTDAPDCFRGAS